MPLDPKPARCKAPFGLNPAKMAAMLARQGVKPFATRKAGVKAPASRRAVVVQASSRPLWAPGVVAPSYLDGTLAGERDGSVAWSIRLDGHAAEAHCVQ